MSPKVPNQSPLFTSSWSSHWERKCKKKKIKSHNFYVWGGILHVITLTGLAAGACPLVFMPAGLSCLFEDHFHAALDGGELHILSTREWEIVIGKNIRTKKTKHDYWLVLDCMNCYIFFNASDHWKWFFFSLSFCAFSWMWFHDRRAALNRGNWQIRKLWPVAVLD